MDPISVAVVGGAAGAFVQTLASHGVEWLVTLVSAQSPAVQQKIESNAHNFIIRLADRVSRLEQELPSDERSVFDDALEHPGTSLLMKRALVSAAATDNEDRHSILSELITQRLTAGEDDMIALSGAAACDVVSALASRHIRLLGVMSVLFDIRPSQVIRFESQDAYDVGCKGWWNDQMKLLCDSSLMQVQGIDIKHLEGVSCLRTSIGGHNLDQIMKLATPADMPFSPTRGVFEELGWWAPLQHIWEVGVKQATLTSTGALIGILYHDRILGKQTEITWYPPTSSPQCSSMSSSRSTSNPVHGSRETLFPDGSCVPVGVVNPCILPSRSHTSV